MNRKKITTGPVSPASTDTAADCPVFALASRLAQFRAKTSELDQRQSEAGKRYRDNRKSYFETAGLHSFDGENAVREMIASTEAFSLEGAAIQIMESLHRVDAIFDGFAWKDDGCQVEKDRRAIVRLLYSAFRVVDRHGSGSLGEAVDESFFTRQLDPWTPVERRVADIFGQE